MKPRPELRVDCQSQGYHEHHRSEHSNRDLPKVPQTSAIYISVQLPTCPCARGIPSPFTDERPYLPSTSSVTEAAETKVAKVAEAQAVQTAQAAQAQY